VRHRLILPAILAACFASCIDGIVYCGYHDIAIEGWEQADSAVFAMPIGTADVAATRQLLLRVSPDYEFRNLSVAVKTTCYAHHADSIAMQTSLDTIECQLADSKGSIAGRGIMHREFSFKLPGHLPPQTDSLRISVSHNMRRGIVAGIEAVGIEIRRD